MNCGRADSSDWSLQQSAFLHKRLMSYHGWSFMAPAFPLCADERAAADLRAK